MTARRFGERLLTVAIAAGLAVLMMGAGRREPDPIGGSNGGEPRGHSGSLDKSFAGDGTTWAYLPWYNGGSFVSTVAEAVALDAAGGIIVAIHGSTDSGSGRSIAIVRYTSDGTLDTTFGSNGVALAGPGEARAMAIQPDGRIVVAGSGFSVARFMADGSPDVSFGSGGRVFTSIRGLSYDMELQADGRIVVAGYVSPVQGGGAFIALVRYETDGSLDVTFGSGGVVLSDVQGQGRAVTVQPDGRILTAGFSFQVVRFNADGTIDTGFGSEGQIFLPFGDYGWDSQAQDILVQPDDKIVVAGGAWTHYDFAIARLNPDGSRDSGFGHDGMVTTDFNAGFDSIMALVLQPDGKLVAAGYGGPSRRLPDDDHFALARYQPNGALDRTFGKGGKAMAEIDDPIYDDFARALALQPDGRLVAAGNIKIYCETGGCEKSGYALARFLP